MPCRAPRGACIDAVTVVRELAGPGEPERALVGENEERQLDEIDDAEEIPKATKGR